MEWEDILSLAVIGTLSAHLEMKPLLALEIQIASGLIAEQVIFIVLRNDILDDGSGFPYGKVAIVGINEGGEASVGVELQVFWGLELVEAQVLGFEG